MSSPRKLKIVTWNVGTEFRKARQAYPWVQFNKVVQYFSKGKHAEDKSFDIVCLQEVPIDSISIPSGGTCVSLKSFGPLWRMHYDLFVTHRGNNALVTLVKKGLVASNTHRALAVGDHFPYAHEIALKSGWLINVHLKAGPISTNALVRKDQLLGVTDRSPSGICIVAGDFNMEPTSGSPGAPVFIRGCFSGFRCSPSVDSTYECRIGKVIHGSVYDYIGLLGCATSTPTNALVASPSWGSFGKHRHFPVEAEVLF